MLSTTCNLNGIMKVDGKRVRQGRNKVVPNRDCEQREQGIERIIIRSCRGLEAEVKLVATLVVICTVHHKYIQEFGQFAGIGTTWKRNDPLTEATFFQAILKV